MMKNFFLFFFFFSLVTPCAIHTSRYSTHMQDAKELPAELSTAHEVILTLSASLQGAFSERDKLKQENEELLLYIKKLLSGNRREKYIDPNQMLIEFADDPELKAALEAAKREAEQELEEITYTRAKNKTKPKPKTDGFPSHIERREKEDIPLSPEDQALADSGRAVARQLLRETLCYQPPKLYVEVQYQQLLEEVAQSPLAKEIVESARLSLPEHLGEEGRYSAGIGASIVCGKFAYHIPYYRLQDIFAGSGWTPSRSTLDYLCDLVYEAIKPLIDRMTACVLRSQYIGMDDTSVTLIMPSEIPQPIEGDLRRERLIEKMLEARKEKKPSLDAKMWAYSGGADQPYDIFDFRVSRHRDGPAEFLTGYGGHVMADCYSGNLSVVLDSKSSMTRMACWSHARRKLFEAKDQDVITSALPLALIGQLYDVERRASRMSFAERTEVRGRESRLLLDRLKSWLDGAIAKSVLPASKLAQAIQYVRNHWEALNEYVLDGSLPIDNNWVERLMKRVACGRKNWLFVGSERAGIRNAGLMSLVSSAHRHDLDIWKYLEDAITHMNRGTAAPEQLLPDVWAASHPSEIRQYRQEERRDKAEQARVRNLTRHAKR